LAETNERRILVGTAPPTQVIRDWRSTHADSYLADIRQDPVLVGIVDDSKLISDVRGTLGERYFFRRAAGPGWALVGDAGHHKDFVIGDGITQALRDARNLAVAIHERKGDESLVRYWRERDIEAQPFFRSAEQQAALNPSVRLNRLIFRRVARSPELIRRFWRQFEHDIDPFEAIPLDVAVKAVFDGLVHGQFGVLREFLAEGKRISSAQAEGKRLKALIGDAGSTALPI
jgi:2-polyprenyl-6-methoxyphenol hydroxylase-like FAD-dependent oxidoreductase